MPVWRTHRRLILALAAIAVLAGLWRQSGEAPAVGAPPPTPGDCAMIGVWSNGFHASLSLRADLLAPEHPIRRLYPDKAYVMIGWGDLAFYRSMGNDLALGFQALLPGGQSGLHVLASDVPVETWYIGKEVLPVALSRAGVDSLAAYLEDSIALQADGSATVVAFEQHGYFLQGRKDFHALNVCNHWVARAMRAAGVEVNAALAFTGDMAIALIGAAAKRGCP